MKSALLVFIGTSVLFMAYGIGCKDTALILDGFLLFIYSTLFLLII